MRLTTSSDPSPLDFATAQTLRAAAAHSRSVLIGCFRGRPVQCDRSLCILILYPFPQFRNGSRAPAIATRYARRSTLFWIFPDIAPSFSKRTPPAIPPARLPTDQTSHKARKVPVEVMRYDGDDADEPLDKAGLYLHARDSLHRGMLETEEGDQDDADTGTEEPGICAGHERRGLEGALRDAREAANDSAFRDPVRPRVRPDCVRSIACRTLGACRV